MIPWNKLTLKEKVAYCCKHRITLMNGEAKWNNEYKLNIKQDEINKNILSST